ncbi:MAG: VanZ family protein [Candidatus Kapabacteria bacterium]|jgi:VanZ family protein|nr:VanZ family protein [Candidatus Kapabacteria bacterium]
MSSLLHSLENVLQRASQQRFGRGVLCCLAALWYGVIFYLSHIPAATSASTKTMVGGDDTLNVMFRFCAHLGVFGVQGILVFVALRQSLVFSRRQYCFALFITFILAVLDEAHQMYVPGRFARVQDILTDLAGAALSIGLLCSVSKRAITDNTAAINK